jgi:iron complex transport system substrate-binding protein
MKKISTLLALTFVMLATVSCKKDDKAAESTATNDTIAKTATHKIVSLNGALTEIVAALGHEKEIVGVDVTSTYPESVKKTATDLNHVSGLSIESIMALQPTLIIALQKDIKPDMVAKFNASGIKYLLLKQEYTIENAKGIIAEVGGILGHKPEDYKPLQDKIDADLKNVKPVAKAPKVLFIYARPEMMLVLGTGTAEDNVIKLAGGVNAANFPEGKPLTPEALVQGNPDIIMLYNTGLESAGGVEGVLKVPGVDKTNAGKNKRIYGIDGGLVHSFGPRVGEAAVQLNAHFADEK